MYTGICISRQSLYIGISGQSTLLLDKTQGPCSFSKILSPLVMLSMEKTMVTKVISELTSVSRLQKINNLFMTYQEIFFLLEIPRNIGVYVQYDVCM